MTKSEILELLELPDSVNENDIKVRLKEKLIYFRRLQENAPNDFLKKRHLQNIEKVLLVMAEYGLTEMPEPDAAQYYSKQEPEGVKPSQGQGQQKKPIAWLIRHTEGQPVKTFSLYAGDNFIGRFLQPSGNTIVLEEDPYVSRLHAVIMADEGMHTQFHINDSALSNQGKPSRNGTYVNGDERRINQKTRLFNNDTIQIGMTKLVFKLNNDNLNNIVTQVEDAGYMKTVVINIF